MTTSLDHRTIMNLVSTKILIDQVVTKGGGCFLGPADQWLDSSNETSTMQQYQKHIILLIMLGSST